MKKTITLLLIGLLLCSFAFGLHLTDELTGIKELDGSYYPATAWQRFISFISSPFAFATSGGDKPSGWTCSSYVGIKVFSNTYSYDDVVNVGSACPDNAMVQVFMCRNNDCNDLRLQATGYKVDGVLPKFTGWAEGTKHAYKCFSCDTGGYIPGGDYCSVGEIEYFECDYPTNRMTWSECIQGNLYNHPYFQGKSQQCPDGYKCDPTAQKCVKSEVQPSDKCQNPTAIIGDKRDYECRGDQLIWRECGISDFGYDAVWSQHVIDCPLFYGTEYHCDAEAQACKKGEQLPPVWCYEEGKCRKYPNKLYEQCAIFGWWETEESCIEAHPKRCADETPVGECSEKYTNNECFESLTGRLYLEESEKCGGSDKAKPMSWLALGALGFGGFIVLILIIIILWWMFSK